jgi:uncharacterized LabA/DUF88 family protein
MCFLDFWNYTLSFSEQDPGFLTDWYMLPGVLVNAVERIVRSPVTYERLFIAGSYDANSSKESKLYHWASNVLARVPGVSVDFAQRQQRTHGPKCTGRDHHEVTECPKCGATMLGTQEKGVDTRIVTEMLDAALTKQCDILVLVSADKDFIPAVEKLQNKNIKCIQAFFPNQGNELGKRCWGSFNLFALREQYRRFIKS